MATATTAHDGKPTSLLQVAYRKSLFQQLTETTAHLDRWDAEDAAQPVDDGRYGYAETHARYLAARGKAGVRA